MTSLLPVPTPTAARRARPATTRTTTAPPVSVFMAVRDEEADLAASVARVLDQDYPGELEVVLAVAPSKDDTAGEAARLARDEPRVVVVDNPAGVTPHGLNAAIARASHDLLVRVDGHAHLPPGYLRDVVHLLETTGAANVGGRMVPVGDGPVSEAVAVAMSSRLGIGGGAFHVGGEAGPQPTVYLGAFRREALEEVGGYDPEFLRAQDWELNHRLRQAGQTVWFDPELAVVYRPRSSWRTFAHQQLRTGGWRRRVVETHAGTADLRYLAPPAAVLAMVLGLVTGLVGVPLLGLWGALGLLVPAAYVAAVGVLGLALGHVRRLPRRARWRVPVALAVMHVSWGTGFLLRTR